jgi:hypothetical protein
MSDFEQKWYMQYEQLVEFKRKNDHCMVPSFYEHDKSLGKWLASSEAFTRTTKFDQTEREFWTKSGSLGQLTLIETSNQTTNSGTSSMKSWSNLNERRGIVSCHQSTKKTSL